MGRLVVITSGKGGVGKSTVAVGLAGALCLENKKVLLVDADEGLRCLDLMLSLSDSLVFDLGDILDENVVVFDAIHKVNSVPGLSFIAAPLSYGKVDGKKLAELTVRLKLDYDYVILDCPAGVDKKYIKHLDSSAEFIVVTNTDAVSVRDACEMSYSITECGYDNIRLIINRFVKKNVLTIHKNIDSIIDESGVRLLGIVPEDKQVQIAAADGKMIKFGRAAMAFQRIAARIEGADIQLPKAIKI